MLGGWTVMADVLVLGAVVVGLLALTLVAVAVSRLRPPRPALPDDDRPPAGLGRLVPVGAQVDEDCRRGLAALEQWMVVHRHRT